MSPEYKGFRGACEKAIPALKRAIQQAPDGFLHIRQLLDILKREVGEDALKECSEASLDQQIRNRANMQRRARQPLSNRSPLAFRHVGPNLYGIAEPEDEVPFLPPGSDKEIPARYIASETRTPRALLDKMRRGEPVLFNDPVASAAARYSAPPSPSAEAAALQERAIGLAARRTGQGKFAEDVRAAFGGRCVVTGALESIHAAHIATYPGMDDNRVRNALLLRSDLHAAFDAGRLWFVAVDSKHIVEVAKAVQCPSLRAFDGAVIEMPDFHRGTDIIASRDSLALAPR